MFKKIALFILLAFPFTVLAQENALTGNVFDNTNRSLLIEGATIKNLRTKTVVITDKDGHFAIGAKKSDLISIGMVGYETDTIYLVNLFPKNIFLLPSVNALKGVDVTATKISPYLGDVKNPDAQPARAVDYNKNRGGVRFGLGYGKLRKEREKVEKLEENERIQDAITQKFTAAYIKGLVKFEGTAQDLKDFMELFRPTVLQVKADEAFNYDYYTAKAYQSWLRLPVSQRKLPPLPKLKGNP
jgi:hypothetical protein